MRDIVEPNRLRAERVNERPMRVAVVGGHARQQKIRPHSNNCLDVRRLRPNRPKLQRRLARRGQLDVDRGEQLGVEQGAVLRAAVSSRLRSLW
jgi:hypothetical protein